MKNWRILSMGFFNSIFNEEKRIMKKYEAKANEIVALENTMAALSDDELKAKTVEFKERLAKGQTKDDILVEAFAAIREAAKRVLGEFPFYVQIIGALVLNGGDIAEMKTGEGKTLTSIMCVYLNALEGKGVHVITVNDYLAGRDAEWMGEIYRFMGLTVGVNSRELNIFQKQDIYNCDITYTTNAELGFDYLRDNMVTRPEDRVLRGLNFAVIDEVDSILVDEARTPLIISGGKNKQLTSTVKLTSLLNHYLKMIIQLMYNLKQLVLQILVLIVQKKCSRSITYMM